MLKLSVLMFDANINKNGLEMILHHLGSFVKDCWHTNQWKLTASKEECNAKPAMKIKDIIIMLLNNSQGL